MLRRILLVLFVALGLSSTVRADSVGGYVIYPFGIGVQYLFGKMPEGISLMRLFVPGSIRVRATVTLTEGLVGGLLQFDNMFGRAALGLDGALGVYFGVSPQFGFLAIPTDSVIGRAFVAGVQWLAGLDFNLDKSTQVFLEAGAGWYLGLLFPESSSGPTILPALGFSYQVGGGFNIKL